MDPTYKQYKSDNLLGFQEAKAVFVKVSFHSFGKNWKVGELYNWQEQSFREQDWDKIRLNTKRMYDLGKIHHDSQREVQNKVGDRLGELNTERLISLVKQMNAIVKERTTTTKEYQDKRIRQSKLPVKQRALIRAWLNRNLWAEEDFHKIRENLLESYGIKDEPKPEEATEE